MRRWPLHERRRRSRGRKGAAPLHPRTAPGHAGQPAYFRGRTPRRPAAVAALHARTRPCRRLLGGRRRDRAARLATRSEEHTSELQSLMRISYAVFCLKKKKNSTRKTKLITYIRTHKQRIV